MGGVWSLAQTMTYRVFKNCLQADFTFVYWSDYIRRETLDSNISVASVSKKNLFYPESIICSDENYVRKEIMHNRIHVSFFKPNPYRCDNILPKYRSNHNKNTQHIQYTSWPVLLYERLCFLYTVRQTRLTFQDIFVVTERLLRSPIISIQLSCQRGVNIS